MATEPAFTCTVLAVYDFGLIGVCVVFEWAHEPGVLQFAWGTRETDEVS